MQKVLPLGQPFIYSYKNFGIPFSIMAGDPNSKAWIMNRFLQLYTRADIDKDVHWLQFYLNGDDFTIHHSIVPWLRIQLFDADLLDGFASHRDFLIHCLNRNQYIEINCDQFYLEHTNPYRKVHRFSNILIYGYDTDEETYDILDYTFTTTRQFSRLKIKMADVVPQIENLVPVTTKVIGLVRPVSYSFDIRLVAQLLEDYITSYPTSRRLYMLHQPYKDAVFGVGIYARMEQYLNLLADNKANMNMLPISILYEHKKCIVELARYLKQHQYIREGPFVSETHIKQVENLAETVRIGMMKYNRTYNKEVIKGVLLSLAALQTEERSLIEYILEQLQSSDKGLVAL